MARHCHVMIERDTEGFSVASVPGVAGLPYSVTVAPRAA